MKLPALVLITVGLYTLSRTAAAPLEDDKSVQPPARPVPKYGTTILSDEDDDDDDDCMEPKYRTVTVIQATTATVTQANTIIRTTTTTATATVTATVTLTHRCLLF